MNFSHLAARFRTKLSNFSGILIQGLDKTVSRLFVNEALYGIIASQSVLLNEIVRQLESQVALKKIEERFIKQLIKPQLWAGMNNIITSLDISSCLLLQEMNCSINQLKKKGC